MHAGVTNVDWGVSQEHDAKAEKSCRLAEAKIKQQETSR